MIYRRRHNPLTRRTTCRREHMDPNIRMRDQFFGHFLWFEIQLTSSLSLREPSNIHRCMGLGIDWLDSTSLPHFFQRLVDFDLVLIWLEVASRSKFRGGSLHLIVSIAYLWRRRRGNEDAWAQWEAYDWFQSLFRGQKVFKWILKVERRKRKIVSLIVPIPFTHKQKSPKTFLNGYMRLSWDPSPTILLPSSLLLKVIFKFSTVNLVNFKGKLNP